MSRKSNELPLAHVIGLGAQQRKVYEFLRTGRTLTRLIAMTELGIQMVTTPVYALRAKGLDIITTIKKDHSGRRYGSYSLQQGEA